MTNTNEPLVFARCFRERLAPTATGPKFFTPDELVARLDREKIGRIFVCPVVNVESAIGTQSNEEVLDFCAAHRERLVPFVNIDPRNGFNSSKADIVWMLEYYQKLGCVGCGVCEACLPIEDRRVRNLFKAAETNGLPLVIRLAPFPGVGVGLSDERGLPGLERALRDFPKLALYVAGTNYFADNEKRLAELRSTYANLHVARELEADK